MGNNSRGCELRPMPPNDKGYEWPLDLNLMQLVEHEKLVKRRMHLRLEFEHIIRLWH